MITNLENKLKFIELIDKMKDIKRACILSNWKRETDAEHSFHLAFLVMVFAWDFPNINLEKCFKLALLHDIVEIYAWDTVITDDETLKKLKKEKEKDALERIEKELGEAYFKGYKDLILEYEENKTIESKFVHQLDKIQWDLSIVLEWWTAYKKHKMTKEFIVWNNNRKIDDTFWFDKVIDLYMKKAINGNMFYNEEK